MPKEVVEENVEEVVETVPSNPSEWLMSLVEQNQDDTDFISMAHQTMQMLNADVSNDASTRVATLEEENKNLKKKFYETFMGSTPNVDETSVEEVEERTSPTLEDILKTKVK